MTRPHRVAVLLLAPVIGYDATIPPQVLGEATAPDGSQLYDVRLASVDGEPVETLSGYSIGPHGDASLLAWADTVVVSGTRLPSARRHASLDPEVQAAVGRIRPGTRLVSICTGAFVLAAAGLLDGRRATTHWQHADTFRSMYPAVCLDEAVLFVEDGEFQRFSYAIHGSRSRLP